MDVTDVIAVARMSDVGKIRELNEDVVASDLTIGLLLLADGMGGYRAGEVASEIAALTIATDLAEVMHKSFFRLSEAEMLADAVDKANTAIFQISENEPQCAGMGTTLVTALFADNKVVVGHVGDSRLYRLRDKLLLQLTEDHSVIQEQLKSGQISQQQARVSTDKNLVTRALGVDIHVALELHEYDVEVGDVYLLCSDGLTDMVTDEEIAIILYEAGHNVERAAVNLVRFANEHGGNDNVSVVIAYVKGQFSRKRHWIKRLLTPIKNG